MSTIHVTQEGSANALALNRDYTQVVIAGRNVLKIFSIEEDRFEEVHNLRVGKNLSLNHSCNDVAWNSVDDHILATGATNGAVVIWNLNKSGRQKQERAYNDHKRTVNKVNFHSVEPALVISGSQDGMMKCFDLRSNSKDAVKTFYSNTESVRDVQFCPHTPQTFAAVSENGHVQLWDIRRPDRYQYQFTAHSGPIFACDWHPEVPWLATASRDKTIKVWDITSKQLEYTIHTIASIGHVKWRPQRKYHIASCALVVDCSINVWDVRRPYIPFAVFDEHKDFATGVAWRGDPQVFVSTGRDSTLYQHAFKDASRPANSANPQGLSLNNRGDVLYACKVQVNTTLPSKLGNFIKRSSPANNDNFHQASSVIHRFSNDLHEDSDCFYACAKQYLLSGRPLADLCEYNANVARKLGKFNISTLWHILKALYENDDCSSNRDDSGNPPSGQSNGLLDHLTDVDQRSKGGGETPGAQYSGGDDETETDDQVDHHAHYNGFPTFSNFSSGLPKGDFCFGESELDIEFDRLSTDLRLRNSQNPNESQQDWTLPNEAFNIRHEIQDRSPPPEQFPNHNSPDITDDPSTTVEDQPYSQLTVTSLPKMAMWDPSSIIVDSLRHYAVMGDVQTAVCVLLVLGDRRLKLAIDEATQEQWLFSYIDLLGRYKLYNVATQVIKLSWIPSVNTLNQQSTRILTNCGTCSKPLQRMGWLCDRCHSSDTALCTLCHQVVKGLYSWCQGCSHGGHLAHMQQWITKHKYCPAGCGHMCEYS